MRDTARPLPFGVAGGIVFTVSAPTYTICCACSRSIFMDDWRLPSAADFATDRACALPINNWPCGSSPDRFETLRPNRLRTWPLASVTTTCSPKIGTPRKVCW